MKRKTTAFFAVFAIVVIAILAPVSSALADTAAYVSLGADLSEEQRDVVLALLDVTEDELTQDNLVTVTNEDEHRYLDSVLDSSLIGTNALSSCKVIQRENGYGIHVVTYNINGISEGMFENALATAGLKDADVVVAAPSMISGTAALVGVMQAYSKMAGTVMQSELIEAATSELVTSGELSELLGDSEKVEMLIAAAKQVMSQVDLDDDEEVRATITEIAAQLGYELDEDEIVMVMNLMRRLSVLDLDPSTLAEQAGSIYAAAVAGGLDLSALGIDQGVIAKVSSEAPGLIDKVLGWFGSAFEE